jgi:hypothetical protein
MDLISTRRCLAIFPPSRTQVYHQLAVKHTGEKLDVQKPNFPCSVSYSSNYNAKNTPKSLNISDNVPVFFTLR